MAFQCNRCRMKAKHVMTFLTINLPFEKQYFWISYLTSPKKQLKIQIFSYLCHFTYCKNSTRFPINCIFYRVFKIFFKHSSCNALNRYKFDFLTHSWWPVDLTRNSYGNFCHWKSAIFYHFLTDNAFFIVLNWNNDIRTQYILKDQS